MPLDKDKKCIYEINAKENIKCECSKCKNCPYYKNIKNLD